MANEKPTASAPNLQSPVDFLSKKLEGYQAQMKTGDTNAARKAIGTEGDLVNLKRLQKRFTEGYYS